MTTYVDLGSRTLTGVADTTGKNVGNWTVIFDPQTMSNSVPYMEVSHIVITGAAGSSFSIFVDINQWDQVQNGTQNSWDPVVPIPLRPGQYLYFFWSDPATDGTPPNVTIWLRYDQDVRANLENMLGMQQRGG